VGAETLVDAIRGGACCSMVGGQQQQQQQQHHDCECSAWGHPSGTGACADHQQAHNQG
jgi:hypothetical protein